MKPGNPMLALLAALAMSAGCTPSAQIFWSPDGQRAAYLPTGGGTAIVMDERGKVIQELGQSSGGMAWSADSTTLYFASAGILPAERRPEISPAWIIGENEFPDHESNQPDKDERSVISMLAGGKATPLFDLPAPVFYLALSPDQKWLAILAFQDEHDDSWLVYAYSIQARRLYPISARAGMPLCFTGPSRLAFVSQDQAGDHAAGQILEIALDDALKSPQCQGLVDVLPDRTGWMQPLGDDLLFTARPRQFPGRPADDDRPDFRLYRYHRANAELIELPYPVHFMFAPSPDGKRILFGLLTLRMENDEVDKLELAVMDADGKSAQVLRQLEADDNLPMWPNWRGNDQITFIDDQASHVQEGEKAYYDVVQYRLTDKLEESRRLSKDWPMELKPWKKIQ